MGFLNKDDEGVVPVQKTSRIISIIALYWVVSISMVFANKHLVGDISRHEDISLFIAWYQCCVVVVMIIIVNSFSRRMGWRQRTKLLSRRIFHQNIVILSLTFVTGLLFNSLMLKHIGVAFYQVARSSTLIFVVILSHFLLGKSVNLRVTMCCGVVILGYYLGASQESLKERLPLKGIIYGLAASFVIALGGTFMKKSEDLMKRDSLKLTFSYNLLSLFIFFFLNISTGQFPTVYRSKQFTDPWFWFVLTCSGFLSLLIGISSALQIQATSPTAHHISISAKSVTQTVMAVVYFQQRKTLLWWTGNILTILGTASYAFVKLQEYKLSEKIDIEIAIDKNTSSKNPI